MMIYCYYAKYFYYIYIKFLHFSLISAGGSGIHRSLKTRKVDCEPGSEYRATKAKGDIKRKGKPDPYAYVPLSRSILNKRLIIDIFILYIYINPFVCLYTFDLLIY